MRFYVKWYLVLGLLPETLYKEKLIPLLINIFHVRDMQIRLVLLKFFPNYIGMVRVLLNYELFLFAHID